MDLLQSIGTWVFLLIYDPTSTPHPATRLYKMVFPLGLVPDHPFVCTFVCVHGVHSILVIIAILIPRDLRDDFLHPKICKNSR